MMSGESIPAENIKKIGNLDAEKRNLFFAQRTLRERVVSFLFIRNGNRWEVIAQYSGDSKIDTIKNEFLHYFYAALSYNTEFSLATNNHKSELVKHDYEVNADFFFVVWTNDVIQWCGSQFDTAFFKYIFNFKPLVTLTYPAFGFLTRERIAENFMDSKSSNSEVDKACK